jgi:hypothetical protein
MRCARGCGGRPLASWQVTRATLNGRITLRRMPLLGPEARVKGASHRMTMCIFYFEGPDHGFERCLELGSDGSLTYWTSPNRYAAAAGEKGTYEKLSSKEAKQRWPRYSPEIERAHEVLHLDVGRTAERSVSWLPWSVSKLLRI